MESVQVTTEAVRAVQIPAWTALLKLLTQPTRPISFDRGKHVRSGYTKNKSLGESKARRRMAKQSRQRNRGR